MERMPLSRRAVARLLSSLALVALAVAACGGSSPLGGGGDPASVVKDALAAVQSKDLTKVGDLACAAKKDEVLKSFDFGSQLGEGSGVDSKQVLDAMSIDTSKVVVGQPTVTGDTATVAISGSMTMNIDKDKMKPIVKAQLEAAGMPADDAAIEAMMGVVGGFAGQDIPMDSTMTLVKENGAWKICE